MLRKRVEKLEIKTNIHLPHIAIVYRRRNDVDNKAEETIEIERAKAKQLGRELVIVEVMGF